MQKFLLTTAIALPLSFGAAFAQTAADPATTAPETTETMPMGTDAPAADMGTTEMDATETDAAEAAAASSAAEKVEVQQAANELRLDWITGTTVTSPDGTNIGSIGDLIIDGDTGEMKAAIIGVGGFLGIGQKQIALPWADLIVNSDAQSITSDLTQEEAEAAPEYVFRDQAPAEGDMATGTADPSMATTGDAPAAGGMAPAGDMATDPAMAPADGMGTAPATGTEAPVTAPATDGATMEPATDTPAPAN